MLVGILVKRLHRFVDEDIPFAVSNVEASISKRWSSGLGARANVIALFVIVFASLGYYFWIASFSLESLIWLALFASATVLIYNFRVRRADDALMEQRIAAASAARKARLEQGEDWGRLDVLNRFRTTVFFTNASGRPQPTSGWRCAACAKNIYKSSDATVDHIKPKSKHPHLRTSRDNLQILCKNCNSTKSAYDGGDWKKVVRKRRSQRRKAKSVGSK